MITVQLGRSSRGHCPLPGYGLLALVFAQSITSAQSFVAAPPIPPIVRVGGKSAVIALRYETRTAGPGPIEVEVGPLPTTPGLSFRIGRQLGQAVSAAGDHVRSWQVHVTATRAGTFEIPPFSLIVARDRDDRRARVLHSAPTSIEAVLDQSGAHLARVTFTAQHQLGYVGEWLTLHLGIEIDATLIEQGRLLATTRRRLDLPLGVHALLPDPVAELSPDDPRGPSFALNGTLTRPTAYQQTPPSLPGRRLLTIDRQLQLERPGVVELPSALLKFSWTDEFRDDLLRGRVPNQRNEAILYSEPIAIRVLPIPPPKVGELPGDAVFVGTVLATAGDSPISMSTRVDRSSVRVGETMRVLVELRGSNSASQFGRRWRATGQPPPPFQFSGFHSYGAITLAADDPAVAAFGYDIGPLRPEIEAIPGLVFVYFDPGDGHPTRRGSTYRVVRAAPISVTVLDRLDALGRDPADQPPNRAATPDGDDLAIPRAPVRFAGSSWIGDTGLPPTRLAIVLALLLPTLLALGLATWRRRRAADAADPVAFRCRTAARRYRRATRRRPGDPSRAGDALVGYLSDRLRCTTAAVTSAADLAEQIHAATGVDGRAIAESVRAHVDARFDPTDNTNLIEPASAARWVAEIESTLAERDLGHTGKISHVAVLAGFLLIAGHSCSTRATTDQDSTLTELAVAAYAAFESGDYNRASRFYSEALEAAPATAHASLLFGLGCAEYRRGRLPQALAAFRGAARRAPRDANTNQNIDRIHLELGVGSDAPPLRTLWESIAAMPSAWTLGEIFWLALTLHTLGLLACAWPVRRSYRRVSTALAVIGWVAIAATGYAGHLNASARIVITQTTTVLEQPHVDAAPLPTGVLRAGDTVTLGVGASARWTAIQLATTPAAHGWIPTAATIRIR